MKREIVFKYVEDDGKVPIQKLTIKEQIGVLIRRIFYDNTNKLRSEDAVTREEMRLRANLMEFISNATEKIRKEGKKSVTIKLASEFESALDYLINHSKYSRFYTFEVKKPQVDFDIKYYILLTLRVK